jgi:hypothetical protein|tara:strand:- start:1769 stop:2455 length:687 start_codon:yes stop_codon:yes gene_type:complete
MAVTQNLKGTSYPSFKIHKAGPTFYQGTIAPTLSAVNGDMYIQHGADGAVWIYDNTWTKIETGANDAINSFTIYNSVQPTSKNVSHILWGETTDGSETELAPTTSFGIDSTSTSIDSIGVTLDAGNVSGQISIPTDTAGLVEARFIARDAANNEHAGYVIRGVITNDSGSTTLLTSPVEEIIGESTSAWYALLSADDANDSLSVKVSGENGKTIKWTAFVNLTLVTKT